MNHAAPPGRAQPLLTVEQLDFGYPGRPLFTAWSATVSAGLTWLQGRPGSGKSTLLKLLGGALAPAAGRLLIGPVEAASEPRRYRQQVFWCGDGPLPFDHLRPPEYFGFLQGLYPGFDVGALGQHVQAFGLAGHLQQRLGALPSGAQRKVALAAALSAGTRVTLLDRPFDGLDPSARGHLLATLDSAATHASRAWVLAGPGVDAGPAPWPAALLELDRRERRCNAVSVVPATADIPFRRPASGPTGAAALRHRGPGADLPPPLHTIGRRMSTAAPIAGPASGHLSSLDGLPAAVRAHNADLLNDRLSVADYRARLCVELQTTFACSRASLWRFGGAAPGDLSLTCVAAFDEAEGPSSGGDVLNQSEYHGYFEALLQHGVYASIDVLTDPHLQGLVAPYFLPRGIRSLLDTTFKVNGKIFGVVCIEQTGAPRDWTLRERQALRNVSSQISLAVARFYARPRERD
ncbi:ATP-binding cassette domain-containing protein [Eleftheria terrae]|uniref:ATP-binding cassette domain-containing protein n=1 Tax=Eleftheria terrae TaxID=1597781 RepID=UPI00263B26D2|nr:ATP-binding cassette domain-containing protein [Eleftheria terrae]WKB53285.1 ATP-binding cassette domain-containing protein [Eleftheria terrae]